MRTSTGPSSCLSRIAAVVASAALVLGSVFVGAPAFASDEAPVESVEGTVLVEEAASIDAAPLEEAPQTEEVSPVGEEPVAEEEQPAAEATPAAAAPSGDTSEDPAAAALVVPLLGGFAPMAAATPAVSVTPASGLDRAGETVTVSGSGYDPAKAVYVAVCEDRELSAVNFTMFYGCVGARQVTASPTSDTQVQLEADGSFSFAFDVPASATAFSQP
ncbi:MAG TPA: hypothetical protein VNQ48_01495, partial [Microbacteriaceae bacterium]|nr:hypothetical protein [Microbacteriaceae bacterium]